MKTLFEQAAGLQNDKAMLGSVLTSWKYKPEKSNKFLYAVLGLLGAFVIFTVTYGPQLLPWLKEIPTIFIYAALFLISPLLKYVTTKGRDQDWTLYEHGYSVIYVGKNNQHEERIGFWRNFKSCTYDSKGVILIPATALQRSVRINTSNNVTEVYSIVRERISIEQSAKMEGSFRAPQRPRTREQKQLARTEKKAPYDFRVREPEDIRTEFKNPFQS